MDTDVLLALLCSIIHPRVFDQATLLDALSESDGNVEKAAEILTHKSHENQQGRKRKRVSGLDEWLAKSPRKSATSGAKEIINLTFKRGPSIPQLERDTTSQAVASTSKKPVSEPHPTQFAVSSLRRKPLSSSTQTEAPLIEDLSVKSTTSPAKAKVVTNSELMEILRHTAPR